jgi:hypothetical protein
MGPIRQQTSSPKTGSRAQTLSDILFFVVTPFLFLRHLLTVEPQILETNSKGIDLASILAVVGWLVVAAFVLLGLRSRHDPRGRRIFAAALTLAVLYIVRMVWGNPNIEGALTAATPLLLVWPFVTAAISPRTVNYVLTGALYVIFLLFAASWRLSQQAALVAFPIEPYVFWVALTIFAVAFGQLLLGRQRLWPLRFAMLMLATGAVFAAFDANVGEAVVLLLAFLLVLAQVYKSVWDVDATPDRPAVTREERRHPAKTTPQPDYLYEKRQLLSMRLATIVADRSSADVPNLEAMLDVVASIMEIDAAYIFQVREDPVLSLVSLARFGARASEAGSQQTTLTGSNAPVLLHALQHDQTLIFSQTDWGESPSLDILYGSLGEVSPGPTVIQPITHGRQGYGLVIIGNPDSKREFVDEESRLCQVAAVRIAAVIARASDAESIALSPPLPHTNEGSSGTNTNRTTVTAAA